MKKLLILSILILNSFTSGQTGRIIPERIPADQDILFSLSPGLSGLEKIYDERDKGNYDNAIKLLADYFKEKFAVRYFFSWKNFRERFAEYKKNFPDERDAHIRRADEHSSMFPSAAEWVLPSKNLKGENVTAYELRHLARQHKSINAAFSFYYEDEKSGRLRYFVDQARSLNVAFTNKKYDDKGNAVYEVFHAGYRVQNWLFVHGLYLASKLYSEKDQIEIIRTFLHTGAQIARRAKKFNYGNHHTKGLTALFLISTLFPEFVPSSDWQKMALDGLVLHLQREVNDDGFQFERSVHYHMGDIDNYFYVYQLGMHNGIKLPDEFTTRFRSMFDALVKMAQPNKKLPVLQDDTDAPWGEFNEIKNAMTIGALLFQDSIYRYFASDKIGAELSWFFSPLQTDFLKKKGKRPDYGSVSLEQSGYYVMRKGWDESDMHMIITAGLSKQKPDHQHGDMLGITAYAYGNQILPNYQVRYNLTDYEFFKNSFVKNVTIVDSIPQARGWKKNEGESGFGKWNFIPVPKTLAWFSDDNLDYYCGTHNGYDSLGVEYLREVFFIKDGFWIVRDQFLSSTNHDYYQIWQGHYNSENKNTHIRSTFQNGAGLDIVQLSLNSDRILKDSFRGKGSSAFITTKKNNFTFETLLYPFKNFETRIVNSQQESLKLSNWTLVRTGNRKTEIKMENKLISDPGFYLQNGDKFILTGISYLTIKNSTLKFNKSADIYITRNENNFLLRFVIGSEIEASVNTFENITVNNRKLTGDGLILIKPLDTLKIDVN
jgi:hypothetical protein